jgi:hypothetical protein
MVRRNLNIISNENNLKCVFQKAMEDKDIEIKIVDTISKFILN